MGSVHILQKVIVIAKQKQVVPQCAFCCCSPPGSCLRPHYYARKHLSPTWRKLFITPLATMCPHLHRESHSWPIFLCIHFPVSPLKRNASGPFFAVVAPDPHKTNEKHDFFIDHLCFFESAGMTLSGALFSAQPQPAAASRSQQPASRSQQQPAAASTCQQQLQLALLL